MKLEWNIGGWLGGQLGGTAWILVSGILTAFQDIRAGLILLAVFAVPNVMGVILWNRRRHLSCYAATQLLLATIGAFGLLAIYVLENRGLWESIQRGAPVSSASAYGIVVLVVAILMVTFYVRFGRNSNGPAA